MFSVIVGISEKSSKVFEVIVRKVFLGGVIKMEVCKCKSICIFCAEWENEQEALNRAQEEAIEASEREDEYFYSNEQ